MTSTVVRKLALSSVDFRQCAGPTQGHLKALQTTQLDLYKITTFPTLMYGSETER
jgi:hypothetical protein